MRLPNVSQAVKNWSIPLIFVKIANEIVDYEATLREVSRTSFKGVWQPYTPQQLQVLPEGQRAWGWFMVHVDGISLGEYSDNDRILYKNKPYKIMNKNDYASPDYGYYEYHVVEDFVGLDNIVKQFRAKI